MRKSSISLGFIAATLSFLMVFAASATPIPLYDIYRRSDALSYSDLALTAVVYFTGAITALLIFGRISNHLGRKTVTFMAFILAALASIILLDVSSGIPLIIARLLLGLACGLTSSAIAAYIVDTGTSLPHWIPATVVSNSPMVGLTIGALASGTLVEYAPYPRTLPYFVIVAVLALCTLLIAFSKESVKKTSGVLSSLRPRFSLPQADRRLYPIAATTFVSTWALGGFYQAFGPSITVNYLGTHSTLMAALVFSSYLLPSAIGGPLSAWFSPANAQRIGMVIFMLAVLGLLFALNMSNIIVFLIASAVAGASQGAALTGSIRSLMADISQEERAGVLSLIYATSYIGAAVPSFIAGEASHYLSLFQVAIGYGVLAVTGCIIVLLFARNPKHTEAGTDLSTENNT